MWGAIVITGDAEDPVLARIASLTERPSGTKVHLQILPGDPIYYAEAMRRSYLLTAYIYAVCVIVDRGTRLFTALKVVFGVSLVLAAFAFSDAHSCTLPAIIGASCPWDHRSLAVAWVAVAVALSAGSVLLARVVTRRRRRLAVEAETRADTLKWRAEHEVSL